MTENITENITVFTHNSIRIRTGGEGAGNRNIYIDPFQMKIAPTDADFILITHDHFDHFSVEDIEKAACDHTILVVPEKMRDKAQEAAKLVSQIITVEPGKSYELSGQEERLEFETVPAYNLLKPFHPKIP